MKFIYSFIVIFLLFVSVATAQNIPHTNVSGPYGVQVNTFNGNLHFQRNDLVLPNRGLSIVLDFVYNSFQDTIQSGYGQGFSLSYNLYYELDSTGMNHYVQRPDGRRDLFLFDNGNYIAPKGIFDEWTSIGPNQFSLTTKYGMKYYFEDPAHRKLTKMMDSNGNTIELSYNAAGFPIEIKDHSNRFVTLNWSNDLLQNIQDDNFSEAREIVFNYNSMGQLTKVVDPMGGEMEYIYDSTFLIQINNERGNYLNVIYDEASRVQELSSCISTLKLQYNEETHRTYVVEENSTENRVTTFAYDEEGMLQSRVGNCCGYNIQYLYDDDLNANQVTDANGNQFTTNSDELGNPLLLTDPLSNTQGFVFGSLNRLSSLTDKNGNTSTFGYDANGNLSMINQPLNVSVNLSHDGNGNLTSIEDGNGHETTFEYNTNNDIEKIDYPISGTEALFEYDDAGNRTKQTDGNAHSIYYQYDKLDRLIGLRDDLNNEARYEYDASSNLTLERDANNNEKNYNYDANNRLESVETPAGLTHYQYDASDNLIATIDANNHQSDFQYDTRNLLISAKDPEGNTQTYSYDGNGNLLTMKDANGDVMTYRYDALDRLIEKSYKGNTDTYSYDANGNLVYCANNEIAISFTFDALNRQTSKTILNWNQTISYEYDKVGNRIKMINSSGETSYAYDDNDRLISILNPKGELTAFVYDEGNRLIEQQNSNGTTSFFNHDAANRLLLVENKRANGSLVSSFEYTYDGNGNRTSITENNGTIWTYSYDGDNRLMEVQKNGNIEQQFAYDPAGNRLELNGDNYTYDDADHLQTVENGASYQFDNNGNLTQKTLNSEVTQYEYDGENRLVKVLTPNGENVFFQYDPFGNRIVKTFGNEQTRYFLDGNNVVLELDQNNNLKTRYTAGLSLDHWISIEQNGTSYFYHSDALGSIRNLTDLGGNIVNSYEYDAFGNATQTGNINNPYSFTGREWDEELNLYYFRSRFYDAEVGRFITKDKFEGFRTRPLSQNAYTYTENNPINLTDPNGDLIPLVVLGMAIANGALSAGLDYGVQYLKHGDNISECVDYGSLATSFGLGTIGVGSLGVSAKVGLEVTMFKAITKSNQLKRVRGRLKKLEQKKDKTELDWKLIDKDREVAYRLRNQRDIARGQSIGGAAYDTYSTYGTLTSKCGESDGSQEEGPIGPPPPLPQLPPIGGDDNTICIPIVRSVDPNEIIAPIGYDIQKWVAQSATLPYTILFENDPEFATAAAQRVEITHQFDEAINRFSFRLGDFGFGDYYFEVPEDVSYYNTQIDLVDSLGILLQVTAGLNAGENMAFWIFESKDPNTGLAATLPANLGFLPVNDTITRVGEGFVNFTVRPSLDAKTGDVIDAQASIIFDDNAAIETNVDFNTIDANAPISAVHTDDAENGVHQIAWSGTDVVEGLTGCGIAAYALYLSTNEGPFLPLEGNLLDTSYVFTGSVDSTYCFFVRAKDFVNNQEALKLNCEPNCMQVAVVELVEPGGGLANGSIELEVQGNDGTLTYQWSHDSGLNSNIATDLTEGIYYVTVTDEMGCSIFATVVLDQLNQIVNNDRQDLFIHKLYPVPAASELFVEFRAESPVVVIEIFDMLGKPCYRQTVNVGNRERQQIAIDVAQFPAGSYHLRMKDRQQQVSGIFIKI